MANLSLLFKDDQTWFIKYLLRAVASDGDKFETLFKNTVPVVAGGILGGLVSDNAVGTVAGMAAGGLLKISLDMILDKIIIGDKSFIINNHNFCKNIEDYFKCFKEAEKIGMKFDKKNALAPYNRAKNIALDIKIKSKNSIYEGWFNDIIIADAYSRLGSIYTDMLDFDNASGNFLEAECSLSNTPTDEKINLFDRWIEIKGYKISNSMRNMNSIASFLQNGELDQIDKDFNNNIHLNQQQDNKQRHSFASYFNQTLIDITRARSNTKENEGQPFYRNLLYWDKMKYMVSIGKYLAIRACYDLIQYQMNKTNDTAKGQAETKIITGLNSMVSGYNILNANFIVNDNAYQDYLNNSDCYNEYLQKTFARNFTILIGLGHFSGDGDLEKKYISALIKLDKKERSKNIIENYNNMWGSVRTSIEKVLNPYLEPKNKISYDKLKAIVDKKNNV
ncbi:hypothetical protein AGMMS50212_12350 [Spirochaetia bacterium]|nr:hypothetical protein AGMMS50212_12350 [Spirochaetia bacterium]